MAKRHNHYRGRGGGRRGSSRSHGSSRGRPGGRPFKRRGRPKGNWSDSNQSLGNGDLNNPDLDDVYFGDAIAPEAVEDYYFGNGVRDKSMKMGGFRPGNRDESPSSKLAFRKRPMSFVKAKDVYDPSHDLIKSLRNQNSHLMKTDVLDGDGQEKQSNEYANESHQQVAQDYKSDKNEESDENEASDEGDESDEFDRNDAGDEDEKEEEDLVQDENGSKLSEGATTGEEYTLLGVSYPVLLKEETPNEEPYFAKFLGGFFNQNPNENADFLLDVRSRLHFTYRTRFVPIPAVPGGPSPLSFHFLIRDNPLNTIENAINNPSCFNTDVGWGCMIRTSQSLLGNALQIAQLSRGYRVGTDSESQEKAIIDWFADMPEAPFSIHNFVRKGMELSGQKPGEWFGPAAASRSIQSLIREFSACGIDACETSVSSGDVYEEDVLKVFAASKESKILFLMGVKLGINAVNEFYWNDIKKILGSKFSVGIAGGRPSSSLYFIGHQGHELLYLDPHTAQPFAMQQSSFYDSCHTSHYGKLPLQDLDPSMLIGILVSGQEEYTQWKLEVQNSNIINILQKKPESLDNVYDGDLESFNMPDNDALNDKSTIVDGDYVDIRAVLRQGECASSCERDDGFQNVQCKKQNIVVIGDRTTTSQDVEVERVLVEQETIGVVEPQREEVADIA